VYLGTRRKALPCVPAEASYTEHGTKRYWDELGEWLETGRLKNANHATGYEHANKWNRRKVHYSAYILDYVIRQVTAYGIYEHLRSFDLEFVRNAWHPRGFLVICDLESIATRYSRPAKSQSVRSTPEARERHFIQRWAKYKTRNYTVLPAEGPFIGLSEEDERKFVLQERMMADLAKGWRWRA